MELNIFKWKFIMNKITCFFFKLLWWEFCFPKHKCDKETKKEQNHIEFHNWQFWNNYFAVRNIHLFKLNSLNWTFHTDECRIFFNQIQDSESKITLLFIQCSKSFNHFISFSFVFFLSFLLLQLKKKPTDIQEFYELTLLDDTKTIQQKTVETLQIASKWEQENTLKINASEVSNKWWTLECFFSIVFLVCNALASGTSE